LNWGTLATGVAPEFQQIRDWQVAEGRFIHEGDVESASKVVVIGQTVVTNLFGNDDPIDAVIRIRNIPFRVVGVLAPKGQTAGRIRTIRSSFLIPPCKSGSTDHGCDTGLGRQRRAGASSRSRSPPCYASATARLDREDDFTIRNLSDIAEAASPARSDGSAPR
jgi:putative ABC transport system permease protein